MQFSTGCVQGKVLINIQNLYFLESCFSFSEAPSLRCGRSLAVMLWTSDMVGRPHPSDPTIGQPPVEALICGITSVLHKKGVMTLTANFRTATLFATCIKFTIFFLPLAHFPICSPPLMKGGWNSNPVHMPKGWFTNQVYEIQMKKNSHCVKQVEKCYSSKSIVAPYCGILRAR